MKTNDAKHFRLPAGYRIALGATLGALLAGACGGTVGSKAPSIGSESHFLAYCEQGCGPGLDCIGGICTRACLTDQTSCSDLASNAACTNQSVEPGEVAVCDVSCAGGGNCAALGEDYACSQGYCRRASVNGSAGSGSAGSSAGSGASGDCNPVGRYDVGKEGGYKPCCPGLTQLQTFEQTYVNGESTPSCVSPTDSNHFSCIQGSCGDGICEDAEAPCGCGVDCPDSNWRAHPIECELLRDQSPPPDIREISITNAGSVPLYIRVSPNCPSAYQLFEVQRDGQQLQEPTSCPDDACQAVMDQGWSYGPSSTPGACAIDCAAPAPVSIEPGQTRREALGLEALTQQLPRGCAAGISSDSVTCFSRVIPQPGNYQLIVRATRDLQCGANADCDCRPDTDGSCTNNNVSSPRSGELVFTFSTSSLFQSQTFEIAAPSD